MTAEWLKKYLVMKPEVSKIFDDLDSYLEWCKWEMQPFNQEDLYRKNSPVYSTYLASKKPKRQNNVKTRPERKRNEQNISN
jgi:hypothetical protein